MSVLYIPAVILGFKDEIRLSSVAVVQIIFFFIYATGIFLQHKDFSRVNLQLFFHEHFYAYMTWRIVCWFFFSLKCFGMVGAILSTHFF